MSSDPLNDNENIPEPDAHGQASMVLVESLIHGLISRRVITVGDALDIVDTAVEVKADSATDLGYSPANLRQSMNLLTAIGESLRIDFPPES